MYRKTKTKRLGGECKLYDNSSLGLSCKYVCILISLKNDNLEIKANILKV